MKRCSFSLLDANTQSIELNNSNSIDEVRQSSSDEPATKKKCISIPRMTCGRTRKGDCRSTGNFTDHYQVSHPELLEKLKNHRSRKEAESTLEKNNRQQSMMMFTKPVETEKVSSISIV